MKIISPLLLVTVVSSIFLFFLILKKIPKSSYKYPLLFSIIGEVLWAGCILYMVVSKAGVTYVAGDVMYFIGQIPFFGHMLEFVGLYWFIRLYPDKKIKGFSLFDILLSVLFLIGVSIIFTNNTIFTSFYINPDEYVDGVFNWRVQFYSLYIIVYLGAGIIALISKIKTMRDKVLRVQFLLLWYSYFFLIVLGTITNWVLPVYLNMPQLNGIGPSLFLINAIIFVHIITRYRFLNIRFVVSHTLKKIVAFLFAALSAYLGYYVFRMVYMGNFLEIVTVFAVLLGVLIYKHSILFFNSDFFYRHIGTTNVEYFRQVVNKVTEYHTIYSDFVLLDTTIQNTFCKKLQISHAQFIIYNEKNTTRYKDLFQYCHIHRSIVVTKELQLRQFQEDKNYPFLSQLQSLGEVCLPFFHPSSKILIGVLMLGSKPFGDIYSQEEIDILEKLQLFISVNLSSILYYTLLKKEILSKTKQLQEQNKKMKEVIQQQTNFITITAHELRTPVTAVVAGLELMDRYDMPLEEMKEYSSKILQSAVQLRGLVQKLFEVQQLDLGKLVLEYGNIKMDKFIQHIEKETRPLMKEQGVLFSVRMIVPSTMIIQADEIRLRQVIHNVLSNAIKFTESSKKKVVLQVEHEEKNIILSVSDNGIGVPDETKKSIFNRFRTNHANKSKGIGLGLYICKKIVELHQGKIWVEDAKGGGAVFKIKLPKRKAFFRKRKA